MVCAGIDVTTFKPHSTRGASTSKAFHIGIPLSDILKQGQWSNAKTFFNFYRREIEEDDCTETWIAVNMDSIFKLHRHIWFSVILKNVDFTFIGLMYGNTLHSLEKI